MRPPIVSTDSPPTPLAPTETATATLLLLTVALPAPSTSVSSAVTSMSPPSAVTLEPPRTEASTLLDTVFSAIDTPRAKPAPAKALDTMVASMAAVSSASTKTSPEACTPLAPSMKASTVLRMVLRDSAPEPANDGPKATASAAATDFELMVASSSASTRMSPAPACTDTVLAMPACTVFWIWFSASETATATAKPAGASEAAREPAATSASILDTSSAHTVTVSAVMPSPSSPSMRARTFAALRLTAEAPDPAAVAAKPKLPTMAAEKASTMLSMSCSDVAVTSSLPPAVMPVFSV